MEYQRFLLLLGGAIVAPFIAHAAPFTQKEAMQAVSEKLSPKAKVVYTEQQEGRALYHIINRGDHNGFCIVGNTPDGEARLLGYTDSGDFDLEEAPEGLRRLLDAYSQRMSQQASTSATSNMNPALRTPRKDIAPMITSKWHQRSPYNDMIPGGCPTGCVATAFGQVMKYYQYPTAYYYEYKWPSTDYQGTKYQVKRVSSFDWSNILDTYDSKSTDTQEKAVATLMQHLAFSIDAYFTPSGTSAAVATAAEILSTAWKYDSRICDWNKTLFEADVWEEMIYTELYNKRPVVMGGQSVKAGGHAFVVDGYDNKNQLYHINWGWASGDGYFDLDLTNTGDSFTAYSESQEATVGIQPRTTLTTSVLKVTGGSNKMNPYYKKGDKLSLSYKVQNIAGESKANCNIGVEVKDLNTGTYRTVLLTTLENLDQRSSSYQYMYYKLSFDTIPVGTRWMVNPIYWNDDPKQYTYIPAEKSMRNLQFEVISTPASPTDISEYFDHRAVVESYISGGCIYSYNADMILDSLQRQCGDKAIIINLHDSRDILGSAKNYTGLAFTGTPNTMIDRQNCQTTSTTLFSKLKSVKAQAPAKIQISNIEREAGTHDIVIKTRSRFGFSTTKSDYRIAYVIIEDSIPNCWQNNSVSGSSSSYFGNVQNLPDPYQITFRHCARAIYPNLYGNAGSIPSQIQKSTDYDSEYRFTVDPTTISDISNLSLATLLIDAYTGNVVNADIAKLSQFDLSDRNLEITVKEPGTLWEQLKDKWQYIKTLKVSGRINGEDMNVIRIMCGLQDMTNVLPKGAGLLTDLDLEDAQLVAGGLVYNYYDTRHYQQDDVLAPCTFYNEQYYIDLYSLKLPKTLKRIGDKALYGVAQIDELYIPDHVEGMIGLPMSPIKVTISPNNKNYVRQGAAIYTAAYDTLVMHDASPSKVVIDLRCNYVDNRYCKFHEADTLVFPCVTKVDGLSTLKCKLLYYGKYAKYVNDVFSGYKGDSINMLLTESPKMYNSNSYLTRRIKTAAAPKANLSNYTGSSPWNWLTWTAIEDLDVTWDERGVLIEADKMDAYLNETHQMRYAISKTKLLGNGVQWTSSNQSVATIDADGNLKPLKKGQTTITVKVKNTSYTAKCVVTVTDNPASAICEVTEAEAPASIFSLDGKPLPAPVRGINIIRQGGRTRKVIVL